MSRKLISGLLLVLFWGAGETRGQKFDATNFIVVGGGFAAGYADFQLTGELQRDCFPAQMARQMNTIMPLPLFRPATPPSVVDLDSLPAILPAVNQSVLRELPFPLFVFNLSIPYLRVKEALERRPVLPLVHEGDLKQSMLNLVLGYPVLILENPPTWSPVEYADYMAPTFIIVQIGFGDVVEAVLQGDASRITPAADFDRDYGTLISRLKGTYATLLLMNVPNPLNTPFVTSIDEAAQVYGTSEKTLRETFALNPSDLITLGGMVEMGDYFSGRRGVLLSPSSVMPAGLAAAITSAVNSYNSTIEAAAAREGLPVYDLHGLVEEVRDQGVRAGSFRLTANYKGGFYSQDGLFPSPTGHALIANDLLALINSRFSTDFLPVDAEAVARRDRFVTGYFPEPGGDDESSPLPIPGNRSVMDRTERQVSR